MISEQDITERLEKIGYKTGEIRSAMRDVGKVIIAATAAKYLSSLPENLQERLRALSETEAEHYIAEHQSEFPPMPQEEFDKIHDETWEDYFRSVGR